MSASTPSTIDYIQTNYPTTGGGFVTVSSPAANCYPWPYIQPSTPYVYPVTYPVMHPHACPICEGKETVPAGFYRDVAEKEGPQQCRACKGKGLIYTP